MCSASRCAAELRKPLAMRPATDENSNESLKKMKLLNIQFSSEELTSRYLLAISNPENPVQGHHRAK